MKKDDIVPDCATGFLHRKTHPGRSIRFVSASLDLWTTLCPGVWGIFLKNNISFVVDISSDAFGYDQRGFAGLDPLPFWTSICHARSKFFFFSNLSPVITSKRRSSFFFLVKRLLGAGNGSCNVAARYLSFFSFSGNIDDNQVVGLLLSHVPLKRKKGRCRLGHVPDRFVCFFIWLRFWHLGVLINHSFLPFYIFLYIKERFISVDGNHCGWGASLVVSEALLISKIRSGKLWWRKGLMAAGRICDDRGEPFQSPSQSAFSNALCARCAKRNNTPAVWLNFIRTDPPLFSCAPWSKRETRGVSGRSGDRFRSSHTIPARAAPSMRNYHFISLFFGRGQKKGPYWSATTNC